MGVFTDIKNTKQTRKLDILVLATFVHFLPVKTGFKTGKWPKLLFAGQKSSPASPSGDHGGRAEHPAALRRADGAARGRLAAAAGARAGAAPTAGGAGGPTAGDGCCRCCRVPAAGQSGGSRTACDVRRTRLPGQSVHTAQMRSDVWCVECWTVCEQLAGWPRDTEALALVVQSADCAEFLGHVTPVKSLSRPCSTLPAWSALCPLCAC